MTLAMIIFFKNYTLSILKILIILPILSVLFFIILLGRIYCTNRFINNCIEADAKIEKYLAYYGSRNYSHKEGTETAIRIIFNYTINNIEYKKGYSLTKNKYTIGYFDNYKKQGDHVKILVSKNNPKNIMLNEILK
jgi:hypothetical protein